MEYEQQNLFKLIEQDLQLMKALKKPYIEKTKEDKEILFNELIQNYIIFKQFNEQKKQETLVTKCVKTIKYEFFEKKQVIMHKGDVSDSLFFLIRGQCKVFVPKDYNKVQELQKTERSLQKQKDQLLGKIAKQQKQIDEIFLNQYEIQDLQDEGEDVLEKKLKEMDEERAKENKKLEQLQTKKQEIEQQIRNLISQDELLLKSARKSNTNHKYFSQNICLFEMVAIKEKYSHFGELAIFTNEPRSATIIATEDCHMGVIERTEVEMIFGSQFKSINFPLQILNNLIPSASRNLIIKVSFQFFPMKLKFRDIIFQEGEKANNLYLIKNGTIQITQKESQQKQTGNQHIQLKRQNTKVQENHICILSTGQFFGVKEIVDKTYKRLYTATATSNIELYYMKRQHFDNIYDKQILQVMRQLSDTQLDYQNQQNSKVEKQKQKQQRNYQKKISMENLENVFEKDIKNNGQQLNKDKQTIIKLATQKLFAKIEKDVNYKQSEQQEGQQTENKYEQFVNVNIQKEEGPQKEYFSPHKQTQQQYQNEKKIRLQQKQYRENLTNEQEEKQQALKRPSHFVGDMIQQKLNALQILQKNNSINSGYKHFQINKKKKHKKENSIEKIIKTEGNNDDIEENSGLFFKHPEMKSFGSVKAKYQKIQQIKEGKDQTSQINYQKLPENNKNHLKHDSNPLILKLLNQINQENQNRQNSINMDTQNSENIDNQSIQQIPYTINQEQITNLNTNTNTSRQSNQLLNKILKEQQYLEQEIYNSNMDFESPTIDINNQEFLSQQNIISPYKKPSFQLKSQQILSQKEKSVLTIYKQQKLNDIQQLSNSPEKKIKQNQIQLIEFKRRVLTERKHNQSSLISNNDYSFSHNKLQQQIQNHNNSIHSQHQLSQSQQQQKYQFQNNQESLLPSIHAFSIQDSPNNKQQKYKKQQSFSLQKRRQSGILPELNPNQPSTTKFSSKQYPITSTFSGYVENQDSNQYSLLKKKDYSSQRVSPLKQRRFNQRKQSSQEIFSCHTDRLHTNNEYQLKNNPQNSNHNNLYSSQQNQKLQTNNNTINIANKTKGNLKDLLNKMEKKPQIQRFSTEESQQNYNNNTSQELTLDYNKTERKKDKGKIIKNKFKNHNNSNSFNQEQIQAQKDYQNQIFDIQVMNLSAVPQKNLQNKYLKK